MNDLNFMEEAHFRPVGSRAEAMRLFARSVKMVEIEVFSYCNRSCWFCPNSSVDRRSRKEHMPEALYLGVLDQLAEVDYSETISYSRYNEPLADRVILERLRQARALLPNARLHTNTNGDYLTREYLDDLRDAGLQSLGIQIYLGNDERYDHERMRDKLHRIGSTLGCNLTITKDDPGAWLESQGAHGTLQMRCYARNFDVNGSNRGGTVPVRQKYVRTSPCMSPFHHLYIDYNGKVMPCCNLRSDVASHADAIVGDLQEANDIFLVYGGARLTAWRESLIGFGRKTGHCASCAFAPVPTTADNRIVHQTLAGLRHAARRSA